GTNRRCVGFIALIILYRLLSQNVGFNQWRLNHLIGRKLLIFIFNNMTKGFRVGAITMRVQSYLLGIAGAAPGHITDKITTAHGLRTSPFSTKVIRLWTIKPKRNGQRDTRLITWTISH